MQEVIPGIFYTLQFLGECFIPYWVINKNLLTDFSDWNLLIQLCLLPLQISSLRLNFNSLIYIPLPKKISSVILSYWKTNTTLLKLVGQKVSIKYHWGKLTDFLPASYVIFFFTDKSHFVGQPTSLKMTYIQVCLGQFRFMPLVLD